VTIISGTADHKFPSFVSIFIIVVWNMPKYPHLSPSLDQAIFWNLMLRLLQMAFLGSIFQKISQGDMPPNPPRMSHAFGARLHDHSHDAGFATDKLNDYNNLITTMLKTESKWIGSRIVNYLLITYWWKKKSSLISPTVH
jgi:hypothetical protein